MVRTSSPGTATPRTVPTRTQSSALTSPTHPHRWSPRVAHGRGQRTAQIVDHMHVELDRGTQLVGRQRPFGDDDHRRAEVLHDVVRALGKPVVVEYRERDGRGRGVGEGQLTEAAGGSVLQPTKRLDVKPDQVGLVLLRTLLPFLEGPCARDAPLERVA